MKNHHATLLDSENVTCLAFFWPSLQEKYKVSYKLNKNTIKTYLKHLNMLMIENTLQKVL